MLRKLCDYQVEKYELNIVSNSYFVNYPHQYLLSPVINVFASYPYRKREKKKLVYLLLLHKTPGKYQCIHSSSLYKHIFRASYLEIQRIKNCFVLLERIAYSAWSE